MTEQQKPIPALAPFKIHELAERSPVVKQPKKEEMLVEKVEKRGRRLFLSRYLATFSPDWWVGKKELLGLLAIELLNLWILLPFFTDEDTVNVFSAPLIPLLAKLTIILPYLKAIRFWLVIFLLFLPLTFYFFVREISRQRLVAFMASLIVSLPVGIFLAARVDLALLTEDGAQVASLTLSMLACLFLHRFLRSGRFKTGIAASILITLTALTSPLGFIILSFFALVITFSEVLLGWGRLKLSRFIMMFIFSMGFASFWYNPKFSWLILTSGQGQLIRETLNNVLPLSFFLLPVLGTIGFLLFENRPLLQPLFNALFLTLGFGVLYLGSGISMANPYRFLPALGISVAFLISVVVGKAYNLFLMPNFLSSVQLIKLHRERIVWLGGGLFLLLTLILVLANRNNLITESTYIFNSEVERRAGIWDVREGARGAADFVGISLTALTIYLVIKLKKKLELWQKR